jgi:hypothetical protein
VDNIVSNEESQIGDERMKTIRIYCASLKRRSPGALEDLVFPEASE